MHQPIVVTHVRWLAPQEGGRRAPPSGPVYAATARFQGEPLNELFSIVLKLSGARRLDEDTSMEVELTLLAPENLPDIVDRLLPGSLLLITEGPRTVAEAKILSVRREAVSPT